jgi:hypothetical protein
MRTTLTLDDDVATRLNELAHRRRVSFREVVNSVLRRGLVAEESREQPGRPFQVRPSGPVSGLGSIPSSSIS